MELDTRTFAAAVLLLFVLHLLTFPSVHLIVDDYLYIDQAKEICAGNFTQWTESEARGHGPLYPAVLCATSSFHGFDVYNAQLVSFVFLLLSIGVWAYLLKGFENIDIKKFSLLFFANSLWWVYSFRTLMDSTIGFFLSVGLLAGFLYFEKKKNLYFMLSAVCTALALFVKEGAVIFAPVLLVYLLYKKSRDIKDYLLVALPFVPFFLYQCLTGFHDVNAFLVGAKATTTQSFEYIPYGNLPTLAFLAGILGLGLLSCIVMWKSMKEEKRALFKDFLLFSLVLVVLNELLYDFVTAVNLPWYHMMLIPFLALIISESSKRSKWLRYLFYMTLAWSIITGFSAAYYFHTNDIAIWKMLGVW